MSSRVPTESPADHPIERYDDLLEPFATAGTSFALLGVESEKFGVLPDGTPLGYDAPHRGVLCLFDTLVERHGWQPLREHEGGPVIALERMGPAGRVAQVTLEPGAQVELSGEAVETVHEVRRELEQHLAELDEAAKSCGALWLGTGFHPVATQAELSWVPKARYGVMRHYFPQKGSRGLDMMRRTATVQVNVDFTDERDAMRKLHVGLALAPIVAAIFASSPFVEGAVGRHKSERAAVWLDADPDRTGLLPAMWRPDASYRDYVEWLLDVPMYLFKRGGQVVANTGQSFRSFWQDGYQGHRAQRGDWLMHMATVFPEARLKRTVELRSVDSLPLALTPAVPALWAGLLYDARALDAIDELVGTLDCATLERARPAIAKYGLAAPLGDGTVQALAEQVVEIAMGGLERRARRDLLGGDERIYLAPVVELLGRGLSPADRLLAGLDPGAPDLRARILERTRM